MAVGAAHGNPHGLAVAPHATGMGRVNSQGPYHASSTGVLHSNSHSVLKGTTVVGGINLDAEMRPALLT